MNRRAVLPRTKLWRWGAAGAGALLAAAGAWWWISGMLSTPATDPGPGVVRRAAGAGTRTAQRRRFPAGARALPSGAGAADAAAGHARCRFDLGRSWVRSSRARNAGPLRVPPMRDAARSYARLQDRAGQARVLRRLAALEFHTGRYRVALDALEQALAVQDSRRRAGPRTADGERRRGRDQAGSAGRRAAAVAARRMRCSPGSTTIAARRACSRSRGRSSCVRGRCPKRGDRYGAALDQYRAAGDVLGSARAIKGMGDLERRAGRGEEAQALYREALDLFVRQKDSLGQAATLELLGDIERDLGSLRFGAYPLRGSH